MLSDEEDDNDCMSKKILFSLAMLPPFDDDLPRGKLPFRLMILNQIVPGDDYYY